jgi:uncharacterized protein YprB with RNaseH-like and TPR domain
MQEFPSPENVMEELSKKEKVGRKGLQLYYLDIETTGVDSEKDKVITVQWVNLDFWNPQMAAQITILPEWESSEENILKSAWNVLMEKDQWDFVPIGFNILHFDLPFLFSRFRTVLGEDVSYEFLDRPSLDLKATFVLMNGGRFKGCNRFIRKTESGSVIPEYYKRKEYAKIVNYIQNEAVAFHEAFSELRNRLNMS